MTKENKVAKKQVTPLDAYRGEPEQAKADAKAVAESTEEMIDMTFTDFAEFMEGKNIGELKAYRTLFQMHLDRADVLGKRLVDAVPVSNINREYMVKTASVFGIINKISDRMGYIDYLLKKNMIH